ncbi:MAG: tetratricopeptide repeat protein [Oscillochloridaceae bacterium umkhey_bin13]
MEAHSVESLPVEVLPAPGLAWQAWLRQQFYLVPEVFVLVVVLGLHLALAAPPWLALLGLLIVGWFGARLSLLIQARRALTMGAYPRATRLSDLALALNPYSVDAQALCATLALAQGQPEQALPRLEQALRFAPGKAELYNLQSAALLETNQNAAAQRAANQALRLDPTSALAQLHLAEAVARQGAEPGEVEALLQAGLKYAGPPADQAALHCALAELLHTQGRHGEANLHLAAVPGLLAASPLPQRAGLHFYLGQLLQRNGALEAAHEHFTTCASLDPQGRFAPKARQLTLPEPQSS